MFSYHKTWMIIVTLTVLSSALSGCGVKPGSLSPPEGSENTTFPRTYPAP